MKFKLLYLMHVPWSWIKQRPHFIAEELSKDYIVSILAEKDKNREVCSKSSYKINFLRYISIQKINNNRIVDFTNYWLRKIVYLWHAKFNDIIWITYPGQWGYIKGSIKKKHLIIYDCMDDMESFYSDSATRHVMRNLEKSICERADLIFVSALSLKDLLEEKYLIINKITVINNAIKNIESTSSNQFLAKQFNNLTIESISYFTIIYVGTVSSWFDFDAVLYFLNNDSQCRIIIFGPTDVAIPKHSRLIYGGILPHSHVFGALVQADMLIMPFLLTPTVTSVNPVKAYEYISSAKPIALIRYPETEYFNDYVNLYNTKEELFTIIQNVKNNGNFIIKNKEECKAFASLNTWGERCKNIKTILDRSLLIK